MKHLSLEQANAKIKASPRMSLGEISEVIDWRKTNTGLEHVEFRQTAPDRIIKVKIGYIGNMPKNPHEERVFKYSKEMDFIDAVENHLKDNDLYLGKTIYTPAEIKERNFIIISSVSTNLPRINATLYRPSKS